MPPPPSNHARRVQVRPEESEIVGALLLHRFDVPSATRTAPDGGVKLAVVTAFDVEVTAAGVLASREGVLPPEGRTS